MLKIEPYVINEKNRLFGDEIKIAGLSVNVESHIDPNSTNYRIKLRNTGSKSIEIESCGFVVTGFKNRVDENGYWVVFIDPGQCAWAGVKRLDYFEPDSRMKVIEEQRTICGKTEMLKFHRSDLQTVVWNKASGYGVLAGFLSQRQGGNKVDIIPAEDKRCIERLEAWQEIGLTLKPAEEISTDTFVLMEDSNPYSLLENYADMVAKEHGMTFESPPITGMMTWYGYHAAITEEIVLDNAGIIKEFFSGYPQETEIYMLLDHGWQSEAEWGSLNNDIERFPHGLKWLVESLSDIGVKFGIWHTPFCITEFVDGYESLKPFMALDQFGKPYIGKASVWNLYDCKNRGSSRNLNYFDGALYSVQNRWKKEMAAFREWGAAYCKMDFFSLVKGYFSGENISRGELYQNSWKSFREGFGYDGHIAPCSCDTNMQLGYCDSLRIAADIGEAGTWPGADEGFKYGHSTISALWYKNRKFWINDADSIQVSKGCSMGEARIRATTVALSGGHLMLSEDLRFTGPDRLEVIKRILPPIKTAARPVNLFENPFPEGYPSIWRLDSESEAGSLKTIALFNFARTPVDFTLTSEMLGIGENSDYIALEWWQSRWLGINSGELSVSVPAEDAAVIHAVPIGNIPMVLSVSHHITGSYILGPVEFDIDTGTLRGEVITKAGLDLIIFGYLPKTWKVHSSMRSHVISNKIGGWQMEIKTSAERTSFKILFENN